MKSKNIKKYIALSVLVVMIFSISVCSNSAQTLNKDPLGSWSDSSPNKQKIISFVEAVTDKNSKDFVPVEDRIATFDMDGTVVCEMPQWLELGVAEYKILNDPNLSGNTGLVAEVGKLNQALTQYPEPSETGQMITDITTQASCGMPQEGFVQYMEKFMDNAKPDFVDLKYKDSFYKPMVELVNYLVDNDFQVYIVSGSERGVIWGACKGTLSLPRSHEIGADVTLEATHEADIGDSKYMFKQDDDLIRYPGTTQQSLKMYKVYNIYHQIGTKPILAFGNTDGDFSMLNYAKSNSQYKNIAFLLCHDDNAREYSYNTQQQPAWNKTAAANGWNVVSMTREFKQVFMKETRKIPTK